MTWLCNILIRDASYDNTMQLNAMQYNTIQYNTIQYNTIQYNTIQKQKQKQKQNKTMQYNWKVCGPMGMWGNINYNINKYKCFI